MGDQFRANSSGADIAIAGSGQPDLDGNYLGVDPAFVAISDIKISAGGSDTVTARLSGIRGLDDDMRARLADRSNWQGRKARMWRMIRDANHVQKGGLQHFYTGYMTSASFAAATASVRSLSLVAASVSFTSSCAQTRPSVSRTPSE